MLEVQEILYFWSVNVSKYYGSGADPGFGQGARNFFRDSVDVAKWSWVSEVSKYRQGSRTQLRKINNALFFLHPITILRFTMYNSS